MLHHIFIYLQYTVCKIYRTVIESSGFEFLGFVFRSSPSQSISEGQIPSQPMGFQVEFKIQRSRDDVIEKYDIRWNSGEKYRNIWKYASAIVFVEFQAMPKSYRKWYFPRSTEATDPSLSSKKKIQYFHALVRTRNISISVVLWFFLLLFFNGSLKNIGTKMVRSKKNQGSSMPFTADQDKSNLSKCRSFSKNSIFPKAKLRVSRRLLRETVVSCGSWGEYQQHPNQALVSLKLGNPIQENAPFPIISYNCSSSRIVSLNFWAPNPSWDLSIFDHFYCEKCRSVWCFPCQTQWIKKPNRKQPCFEDTHISLDRRESQVQLFQEGREPHGIHKQVGHKVFVPCFGLGLQKGGERKVSCFHCSFHVDSEELKDLQISSHPVIVGKIQGL